MRVEGDRHQGERVRERFGWGVLVPRPHWPRVALLARAWPPGWQVVWVCSQLLSVWFGPQKRGMKEPHEPDPSSRWAVWGVLGDTPGDSSVLLRCSSGLAMHNGFSCIAAAKPPLHIQAGARSQGLWGRGQAARDLLLPHCWEDAAIRLSRKARYHGRAQLLLLQKKKKNLNGAKLSNPEHCGALAVWGCL